MPHGTVCLGKISRLHILLLLLAPSGILSEKPVGNPKSLCLPPLRWRSQDSESSQWDPASPSMSDDNKIPNFGFSTYRGAADCDFPSLSAERSMPERTSSPKRNVFDQSENANGEFPIPENLRLHGIRRNDGEDLQSFLQRIYHHLKRVGRGGPNIDNFHLRASFIPRLGRKRSDQQVVGSQ